MKRIRMIMVASVVALAALGLAAAARPQALIVDTTGQPGDASHSVAPIDVFQENGDTTAAASVGHGTGSAANAAARNEDDSAAATVGCIDAAVSSGDLAGSASLGNCNGGSALGGGAAGVDNGATGGGLDLGCLSAGLDGSPSAGAQLGACEGAAGEGDNGGDDTGPDEGVAGEEAGGVAGAEAGGELDGSGSGDGQGGGEEPCGTFDQLAGLATPGQLPAWLLGLVALGGFGLGTFLARRRSKGVNLES